VGPHGVTSHVLIGILNLPVNHPKKHPSLNLLEKKLKLDKADKENKYRCYNSGLLV
jgi:hypothetical protein